ncbi:PTS mannose/fructose/sorbose/N-acetylgalactosamine transporter subunit IIC [Anaerorhabdus sp.]|uniref:PTS mannose/fructose/sorbose/N-acetylgalactosamine transporter subunit IIC n=1 Tax=Anaerorhabdus sp. TaxID=1872524 RepID=UPI002FCBE70F
MTNALLLGLVYVFAWCADNVAGASYMHRPIVVGALTGLVMGHFTEGLIIGGTMELAWMGFLPYAGMITGEERIGAILGTYFAISTGNSFDVAIAIALPAAILGANISTTFNTIGSYVMHRCDNWAREGNIDKINRFHVLYGVIKCLFMTSIVVVAVWLGTDAITNIINMIPEPIMNGLSKASDLLPAVGFAMLINIMWDKRFIPLYFVGFALSAYLGLNVMAITIISLALALFRLFTKEGELEDE